MKAAVCHSFDAPLRIEDVILAPPGTGQVEVTLAACAICHSDIHYADGAWGGTLPAVYGHEAAGHVRATGPGVTGFAPGDPVVVTLIRACGTCCSCATGHPTGCETPRDATPSPLRLHDGTPLVQGMATAGFAERVVVHQSQIAAIPANMPMASAALLACGVITGAGAVFNTAAMPAGAQAVVIGAGGVGLNTIQAARLAGARSVIALDLSDDKLAGARAFGATHALRADAPDLRAQVLGLTGGRGADHVFVTVGAARACEQALDLLAPRGTAVLVGMPASGAMMQLEPLNLVYFGQRILGSSMGATVLARDIPMLVDLYRQGRLMLDELVTGRWRLDQINEAIADTRAGYARRNVIVFGEPAP